MSILTRKGYVVHRDDLDETDVDELTVTPEAYIPDEPLRTFELFSEQEDGTVVVPRYWGEDKFGSASGFFCNVHDATNLKFSGTLRSELQKHAADSTIEQLWDRGGGVLSMPTGAGKTTIALFVACALKLKTLVVVHKSFLMDQWNERIRQFVPSASIGRIQQNTIDVEDHDIVLGMLQSIAMHEYEPYVFEGFGLVVYDEVHVVPAPVFSRAMFKTCAPCMLGLSATPERKDGLSHVINWFVGPMFFRHRLTGKAEVDVFVVEFPCNLRPSFKNKYAMATATNKLCDDEERNALLVRIVSKLVTQQRKIILLTDRRAHCEVMQRMLGEHLESALYLGGMKEHELKESETKQVLLATYHLAKEGLDIPALDAVVLACPRSDVVQACGRILHGKSENPVIVDVVDQWIIGRAQFNKRKIYYEEAGFTLKQSNF